MNGLMRQEPYDEVHAVMYGPGVETTLILKIPNNKDFTNLEKCHFYDDFQQLNGEAINDELFGKLYYLRDKIKDYCYAYDFITYECEPALELLIYDERDK